MRIFGRPVGNLLKFERAEAPELQDLEVVADPQTLRRLADFLSEAAAAMETKGETFEHLHLLDAWGAHGTKTPDILVSRETQESRK